MPCLVLLYSNVLPSFCFRHIYIAYVLLIFKVWITSGDAEAVQFCSDFVWSHRFKLAAFNLMEDRHLVCRTRSMELHSRFESAKASVGTPWRANSASAAFVNPC